MRGRSEVQKSSTETSCYEAGARALNSVDKRGTHRGVICQLEGASWQSAVTIRTDTKAKDALGNVQSSPGGAQLPGRVASSDIVRPMSPKNIDINAAGCVGQDNA